jgi:hypothetical protein
VLSFKSEKDHFINLFPLDEVSSLPPTHQSAQEAADRCGWDCVQFLNYKNIMEIETISISFISWSTLLFNFFPIASILRKKH